MGNRAAFKLKAPLPTEDDEAQCLIEWARWQKWKGRRLSDLLVMIPNGAYLGGDARQRAITMAKLKRCGFRNGVSDYFLAVPRGTAGGLWLELKRRQLGVVSAEQSAFAAAMEALGYATAIAKGWEEAKDEINLYLGVLT
jgi:hypothetical protein